MASFISQEPSEWGLAYLPNVYVIDGLTTEDRYVLTVEVNGSEVATLLQPRNPAGVAMFDVARILQGYLQTAFVETTPKLKASTTEMAKYRVRHGLETAGVVTYYGYSDFHFAVNGYGPWQQFAGWPVVGTFQPLVSNEEACICEFAPCLYTAEISDNARFLTNWPLEEYKVRGTEYHTLSFFNKLFNETQAAMLTQPFLVKIDYYNALGAALATYAYGINATNGLGPRLTCNAVGPYTYAIGQEIGHVGAGPQNLKEAGLWFASPSVDYYTVGIYGVDACYYGENGPISDCEDTGELLDYIGEKIYEATFRPYDACTPFEPIRLSFLNQYGMKDYYTFDRRNTKQVNTNREDYQANLGTWSDSSWAIFPTERGRRTFSSEIQTEITLSTDWMTDEESRWLQELYTSPVVYMFSTEEPGAYEPVVITSSTYEEKTYNRNRFFQHTITVRLSNDKIVQRG